jgi:signal transduction histidine kinase
MKSAMEAREQERQRIAREMHDDLGSGLTSIVYQANALKQSQQGTNDISQIDKITNTSTELVARMRDIVWAMNYENDTLDDLVAYIRHQSGSMLSQANIDYEINTPDEIQAVPIGGEQRRNIYLASKEALHNVIKHANATHVSMRISVNDMLNIRIADNGKGPGECGNKKGNGLRNMEVRMRQSGGHFSIEAAEPGTIVNLSMPIYN